MSGWLQERLSNGSSGHEIYPELQWLRRGQFVLLLLACGEIGSLQFLMHQSGLSVPASQHLQEGIFSLKLPGAVSLIHIYFLKMRN